MRIWCLLATVGLLPCLAGCPTTRVISLAEADTQLLGAAGDGVGTIIAPAGDVDGDGLGDILIGNSSDDEMGDNAGKTYLMLGSTMQAGGSFDLGAADVTFLGENEDDRSGGAVAGAGDVDGDGLDDILIGATGAGVGYDEPGKAYLLLGSTIGVGGDLALATAEVFYAGEEDGDQAGTAVAGAGDVDGDGLDDILVGAKYAQNGGITTGKAYLLFGAGVTAGPANLAAADASFTGEHEHDEAGMAVAGAGDVDGDGLGDILIGATHNDDGGNSAGKAYLLFGSSIAAAGPFPLATADVTFTGQAQESYSGFPVTTAGDWDGDGLDDILISSAERYDVMWMATTTYLLSGSRIRTGGDFVPADADVTLVGGESWGLSYRAVAPAGDMDDDGLSDILIGNDADDEGGRDAGMSYLMSGATLQQGGTFYVTDAALEFLGEARNDHSGKAVSSAGDVNGDGLDDVLIGAPGNGAGGYAAGKVYVVFTPL